MGGLGKPREDKLKIIGDILKANPLIWGIHYFPHHFRSATPICHVKIIQRALTNRYFAAQCPRELGKSTIISF